MFILPIILEKDEKKVKGFFFKYLYIIFMMTIPFSFQLAEHVFIPTFHIWQKTK